MSFNIRDARDAWREIYEKHQGYIEDLHRQNTPQQDLLDLISTTERPTGAKGEDILFALNFGRKY